MWENVVKTALIYSVVTIYLGLRPRITKQLNFYGLHCCPLPKLSSTFVSIVTILSSAYLIIVQQIFKEKSPTYTFYVGEKVLISSAIYYLCYNS